MKAHRTGFTIVELLVVITIIALFMALIFPVLAMSRESARRTLCITNMQQLCKAAQQHMFEKNSFPPLITTLKDKNGNIIKDAGGGNSLFGWTYVLLPRIEKADVYEMVIGRTTGTAQPAFQATISIYICPSDPPETAGDITPLSYAACAGMIDAPSNNRPPDWRANGVFHSHNNIGATWIPEKVDSSFLLNNDGSRNTICFTENVNLISWMGRNEWDLGVVWQTGNTPPFALNRDQGGPCDAAHARPSSRHPAGFVVGFCDGHVMFMNEAVDYTVYARLMTPAGKLTQLPGNTSAGPIGNQGTPPTAAELEALQ